MVKTSVLTGYAAANFSRRWEEESLLFRVCYRDHVITDGAKKEKRKINMIFIYARENTLSDYNNIIA